MTYLIILFSNLQFRFIFSLNKYLFVDPKSNKSNWPKDEECQGRASSIKLAKHGENRSDWAQHEPIEKKTVRDNVRLNYFSNVQPWHRTYCNTKSQPDHDE